MAQLIASHRRFDRAVAFFIVGLLLIIALIIWRGDQVGIQVVALDPGPNANYVPLHARLQIRFDQPLITTTVGSRLTFQPPISGTIHIVGDQLVFSPATAFQPNTVYAATLTPGLRSQENRLLRKSVTWRFQTNPIQVLYLAPLSDNTQQLFVATLNLAQLKQGHPSAPSRQLTFGSTGVWDFTVSSADQIVYSLLNADGVSDLWLLSLAGSRPTKLFDCQQAVCNSTAWSPDNRVLALSRRNLGAMSPPRLWLLDVATQVAMPLFTDDQRLGFEPRWSSDQQWLSYLAPDLGGVGVRNRQTQTERLYPTTSGEPGIWHPQRNQLLVSVVRQLGERTVTHLLLVDVATGAQQDLSGADQLVEDNGPAWSPDGAWIAFRRKVLAGPQATLGAQVWRMRADGSQATRLTADPTVDHSQLAWSPDGQSLLLQKLPLKGPDVTIAIWLLDVQSGQQWKIVQAGQRPLWLP